MDKINKKFLLDNSSIVSAIFNDNLSLKGNDLKSFLSRMTNVTEYGRSDGVANMNGLHRHLNIPKNLSSKPDARYQALIVNTSNLLEPGEHWFLMASDWGGKNPLEGEHFTFDSYGRSLDKIYQESGTSIPKNFDVTMWKPLPNTAYQAKNTITCGHYLLDVLHLMNTMDDEPSEIAEVLGTQYMNKSHPIFGNTKLDSRTALLNDIHALKNAEALGAKYTDDEEWYKNLRSELYD